MVPARSRKTAGRKAFASGKALAPNVGALDAIAGHQHRSRGFKDALDGDARHATMVDGALAEKTGAAIHRFANQRELWCHGQSSFGFRVAANTYVWIVGWAG